MSLAAGPACEACPHGVGAAAGAPFTCARRQLGPGQHLFSAGDLAREVIFVRKGALRLYWLLRDGRRRIIGFRGAGEAIIPEEGQQHRFSAQAVTAAEVRAIPLTPFHAAARSNSTVLVGLHRQLARERDAAYELIAILGRHDAEASVAAFLLDLDDRTSSGTPGEWLQLSILRADIADYLGLSHETVSRVLTAFRQRRLIEIARSRQLRLLDRAVLVQIAGKGDVDRKRIGVSA
ncbi:Crp/Fnr family transcriptional regulator [Bradyrhizobium sp. WD16]|uniref:Crp/Fnr family transcriptional regulator n=1 Tax=Bradyrhizobium sp. WD16 TaxID=1521768 RepID=UPI0020A28A72|nr:helix-turn-helix domain-containing protein [Bradyrhizobium sp. WD16]